MDRAELIADEIDAADAELLTALRAGDEAAFESLARNHGGRMLSVARPFLANEDDAQDAVQEAFLSAFKALAAFDGRSRISTWLHRIVVNAALMKLRTRKRHPEQSIDDVQAGWTRGGSAHALGRFGGSCRTIRNSAAHS